VQTDRETVSLSEFEQLVQELPANKHKRRQAALAIAASGHLDTSLGLEMRKRARQYQPGQWLDAGAALAAEARGWSRVQGKASRASRSRVRTNMATVAVSYKLRARALYFYRHDIAYYGAAFRRGKITRGELQEIFANIRLMA
jgi:hypothetical protein